MKKVLAAIFCVGLFLSTVNTQQALAMPASEIGTVVHDGSSFEAAIVIEEKTESAGVPAEYAWIREHYPESTSLGQSFTYKEGKPYDIIKIKTKTLAIKSIYFDISNFYGKM